MDGYRVVAEALAALGVKHMFGVIGIPVTQLASAAQVPTSLPLMLQLCPPLVATLSTVATSCLLPRNHAGVLKPMSSTCCTNGCSGDIPALSLLLLLLLLLRYAI
jgi:hypothetical protein